MEFDMVPARMDYPAEDRKRNQLCVRLLDVISDSVKIFRPSQSLSCLSSLTTNQSEPSAEVDIVVSGGGLKGYFVTGCSHVLLSSLERQNIAINRIAGASAGAWVGLFMLTDFGTENWIETYYKCKERSSMTMHEAYDDIWPWVNACMGEDAWKKCRGRLFISITEVSWKGFTNHMISDFTSNRDLFDACLASSTVPFLSLPHACRRYRGMWVVDGGLTNNTPVFPDHLRRQLVFRLSDVFYPGKYLINPGDHCIEALVVRGAILMSRFLQGEPNDSFAWLDVNESKAKIARRSFWRRRIAYVCTAGLASYSAWKYRQAIRDHVEHLLRLVRLDVSALFQSILRQLPSSPL